MKNTLVLALDIGTSSVRAMLFDANGKPLPHAEVQLSYAQRMTADGGVDTDAEALLALTVNCARQLLRATDKATQARIAGVGASCFWHSLLGVGPDGRAITPVYSWADTRSGKYVERLKTVFAPAQYHKRTGCFLHPSFWPSKLLWLADTQPDLFPRVKRWMSFGEYAALRLFGRAGCSLSMASGTGVFNLKQADWDEDVLHALSITRDHVNPLVDRDTAQTGLIPEFARSLDPLKNIPWFPVIGDGACSNLGSGATSDTRIAMNVGTSGAMRVVVEGDKAEVLPGLFCYQIDRARFVLGGGFTNGGNAYAWQHKTLQLEAGPAAARRLAAMAPDSHGLTILPFWAGERSPGWHPDARATITGMNLHTTALDIMRATLESVALSYDSTRELLQNCYPGIQEIVASGGALIGDPAWVQIMADVFGVPVILSNVGEASSRGAALLALESLGVLRDVSDAPKYWGRRYLPDLQRHKIYQGARKRYDALYKLVLDS